MRKVLTDIPNLVRTAQRRFARDAGPLMAGSVAFFASLSLLPLVLLLVSAIGHLVGSEEAHDQAATLVRQYLPGSSQAVLRALDTARAAGGRWLVDIVGTLGLLWSGMNLFATLSLVLTIVWVGEPKRSFFARKAISFLAVVAAGLLFLASILITSAAATLSSYAAAFGAFSGYVEYLTLLDSAFSWILQAVLAAGMFFLLYWLLPASRPSARAALLGAVPAALLWTISRSVFSLLVAGSSRYGQLYGPLAGAVLLLLWIYYSAYIMIWCAELGATAERRS